MSTLRLDSFIFFRSLQANCHISVVLIQCKSTLNKCRSALT